MKKFRIISFLFLSLSVSLFSCKSFWESSKDVFFDVLHAFTEANIKKLFPEENLQKDSVFLQGKFDREKVRKILGQKVSDFLTPQGKGQLLTRKFDGEVRWIRTDPDSVMITIFYVRYAPINTDPDWTQD